MLVSKRARVDYVNADVTGRFNDRYFNVGHYNMYAGPHALVTLG